GAIRLAEKSRSLLKSEETLFLRKYQQQKVTKKRKVASSLLSFESDLLTKLKALRSQLANFLNVPPYVVFHDASLEEMAHKRPLDENQFREISGVGDSKLKKYGNDFLELIGEEKISEKLHNKLSDTVNETLFLFTKTHTVAEIARSRGLTESTVYTHLADAIEAGVLSVEEVLDMPGQELEHIRYEMEMAEVLEHGKLKPVYEALQEEYDYGVLRCVLASFNA
ncbi:MAG: HRDC domain-containing protein, partial [Gammaproteobacteria bacterium]|nr:HRDC domain-containing protein [Gammaproteobacteria bacterium]